MAGTKRKLEDNIEANGASPTGDIKAEDNNGTNKAGPAKSLSSSSSSSASTFSAASRKEDTIIKSTRSNGRLKDHPPRSSTTEAASPPARKRRRTREEILLAEESSRSQLPRSTRQSARILSQRRATDPAPNVGSTADLVPKAASMEPSFPPGDESFEDSQRSLPSVPAIPDFASLKVPASSGSPNGAAATSQPAANGEAPATAGINGASTEEVDRTSPEPNAEGVDGSASRSDDTHAKPPKQEQSDETQPLGSMSQGAEDDSRGPDDEPSSSIIPALTLTTTDLPLFRSTDSETPVGAEAPASALSMSPGATQSEAADFSASALPVTSGRGRGGSRLRGKGKGRRAPPGRKPAAASKGAPKLHLHDRNLSPTASAAVKKLRDRQKELHHAFRRVASAQRAALAVLANRAETRLVKDPKAHMDTPLYQELLDDLQDRLEKRQGITDKEYNLKVQCADQALAANEHWIKSAFKEKVESIRDEHILAAQGDFLQYLDQCRQAGDEDHTESEGSDIEISKINRRVPQQFIRGFDSSHIRQPSGAALYERANCEWDEFVQRARIGGDIFALLKEINDEARRDKEEKRKKREEAKKKNKEAVADDEDLSEDEAAEGEDGRPRFSDPRFQRLMSALADACELAEGRGVEKEEEQEAALEEPLNSQQGNALDALAEIALRNAPETLSADAGPMQLDSKQPPVGPPPAGVAIPPPTPLQPSSATLERASQLVHPQGYPMPPRYSEPQTPGIHRAILPQPVGGSILPPPPSQEHPQFYQPQYGPPPPAQQQQQHGPPLPPPPPPSGHPPSQAQQAPGPPPKSFTGLPRPLLPAGRPVPQGLPPIREQFGEQLGEQLRLPDPFSSAPHHLPGLPGLRYSTGPPPPPHLSQGPPPLPHPPPHPGHRPSQAGLYGPPSFPPQYMPAPPGPPQGPVPYPHPPPQYIAAPPGSYHQPSMYPTPYYSPYHPYPPASQPLPPPPRPHQGMPPHGLHQSPPPQQPPQPRY